MHIVMVILCHVSNYLEFEIEFEYVLTESIREYLLGNSDRKFGVNSG
jgi:hypothetical protein